MRSVIQEKIVNSISGGILFIKSGKIKYVNPAAEKILKKNMSEMLDKPFATVFVEYEENDDFNQTIMDAIYDFENPHENIVQYFNGENFQHFHLNSSTLLDNGQKIGLLILIDDVTEIMKLRGIELDLQKIKDMNQQLKERNRQLKIESETDKLTGLLNKKTFEKYCKDYLQNLNPNDTAAFYVIDLDHFKEANDTCGHQAGDMILQIFSNALREIFNENAKFGRFGGDEFVVLLKNPPNEDFVAEKAQEILKAATDIFVEGLKVQITASIGVANISAATDYQAAFNLADKAVYFVKEHGRNNFKISSSN